MKNNYYFSHDSNARNDEKILQLRSEYGNEAYAIYFFLLESMSETEDGYLNSQAIGGLSLGYSVDKQKLKLIIEMCISLGLFIKNDDLFTSERMQKHLKFRKKLKKAGEKGAKSRWKNSEKLPIDQSKKEHSQAIASPLATPMQRKGKERKGKNTKKEVENYSNELSEYLKTFNDVYGTKYKSIVTLKNNFSFWRNQYSFEEILRAVKRSKNVFWAKQPTPELLLRTKNKNGECDYIGEILNTKSKDELELSEFVVKG